LTEDLAFVKKVYLSRFKRDLTPGDKKLLIDVFQAYTAWRVPLATPVTLLRQHSRQHQDAYLARQHYLKPYPDTLAPRAAV
jgi:uncharacterized protein YbgA (DUF1722 family)